MATLDPKIGQLPTPIARVLARRSSASSTTGGDYFLIMSYVAEISIKLLTLGLASAVRRVAPELCKAMEYDLLRADGLGNWVSQISRAVNRSVSSLFPSSFSPLVSWLVERKNQTAMTAWADIVKEDYSTVLTAMGLSARDHTMSVDGRGLLTALVFLRNKTKAHGAVGPNFFSSANAAYTRLVHVLLCTAPSFAWDYAYVWKRESNKRDVFSLKGMMIEHKTQPSMEYPRELTSGGICVRPPEETRWFYLGPLARCDRECAKFEFANGSFSPGSHTAEFIDYCLGQPSTQAVTGFESPPEALSKSETEGPSQLDVHGNVYANLPKLPESFVERPQEQKDLRKQLTNSNHAVVTLHGRGGIGKTSLALKVIHELAAEDEPNFEHILWFSSRDIDLRTTGPVHVKQHVRDLKSIADRCGELLYRKMGVEELKEFLLGEARESSKGNLFVFDNFETLSDPIEVYHFLDANVRLPNRILITSRERQFKADWPIEVVGMEWEAALELMTTTGNRWGIAGLLSKDVLEDIYSFCDGHPYAMLVMIGEVAKDRKFTNPRVVFSKREDILQAVFERSFEKLSHGGRTVYLSCCSWNTGIPEVSLIAVLGQREIDVEQAVQECQKVSLIQESALADGTVVVEVPQLSRVFGKRKLIGDPDRLVIQEDVKKLQSFGVISTPSETTAESLVEKFSAGIAQLDSLSPAEQVKQAEAILNGLARLVPRAWLELARLRARVGGDRESTYYAFRRYVEVASQPALGWLEWAGYAATVGDTNQVLLCHLGAADAEPTRVETLREAAYVVCQFVSDNLGSLPVAKRGVYLATIRDLMERVSSRLDATALSRLAWLYLLEANPVDARRHAEAGLREDPENTHCKKLINRLDSRGS